MLEKYFGELKNNLPSEQQSRVIPPLQERILGERRFVLSHCKIWYIFLETTLFIFYEESPIDCMVEVTTQ